MEICLKTTKHSGRNSAVDDILFLYIGKNKNLMGRFPVEICHLSSIRTHQSKKVLNFLPVLQLSAKQQIQVLFYLVLKL